MRNISLKTYLAFITLIAFSGCAHEIQLVPDLEKLRELEPNLTVDKNVAYFISEEKRAKQVTTPGGGGDKVTYKPYADSESPLNTILSKIFSRVYSINSIDDSDYITEKKISYIFVPEITTDSSSSSVFTWPPTEFTINLSCKALDSNGQLVWEKDLNSIGNAEFSEFKSDFSLAAKRASESLFVDLLNELVKAEANFK